MRRTGCRCIGALCLSLMMGMVVSVSAAQETKSETQAILVLDASGSMWGQIGGTAKIEIAREVIADLVRDLPANTNLGLTAYGHRKEGDCGDIEHLKDPGPLDPNAFAALVEGISPQGKTPLSEAVRQAAVRLRYAEQPATVILVSDGLETCNADPCALAEELEKTGVGFTAHVIGFDLKEEEREALQCLATNTGGMFLHAADADTLKTALATTITPASTSSTLLVPVLKRGGEVPMIAVNWSVLSIQADSDAPGDVVLTQTDNVIRHEFPPGRYVVEAKYANASGREVIDIGKTSDRRYEILLNAGLLSIDVLSAEGGKRYQGPPYPNLTIRALDPASGGDEYTHVGNPADFVLRTGRYEITAKAAVLQVRAEADIRQGELTKIAIPLTSGRLRLTGFYTQNGERYRGNRFSGAPNITWKVHPLGPNGESVADVGLDYMEVGDTGTFVLSPGRYFVTAKAGAIEAETFVTVEADRTTEQSFSFDAGRTELSFVDAATGRPIPDVGIWYVYAIEADGSHGEKYVAYRDRHPGQVSLPTGEYLAQTEVNGTRIEGRFEIKPGDNTKTELMVNAR